MLSKSTQAADPVPKLCFKVEKYLSLPDEKRKHSLPYFLTHEEFEKWVAQDIRIVLDEDEKKVAVGYLDSVGIVSKYYLVIFFLIFLIDN